jgi:pectate lyase
VFRARLREALLAFGDRVLRQARVPDVPVFVDALRASDGAFLPYDAGDVARGLVLANPAYQQTLLRFLCGLSALTGDPRYRAAAERTTRFLLRRAADPNGLLLWGGHVAFDVGAGRPVAPSAAGWAHELKHHYPFFELMWAVDPEATRRYVEAAWNAHVIDWASLDFNRHGRYGIERRPTWDQEYRGGPVRFWGKGLTFVNAGSDLYYAAAMLASFTDEARILPWAKRLARRYVETREPGVGVSAYQFSQSASAHCDGPSVRGDRARYQLAELVGPDHLVLESTLFRPRPIVQRAQLHLSEVLGDRGREFETWAVDELLAWTDVAYREGDNAFLPMLTDGLHLDRLTLHKDGYFGPAGRRLAVIPAGPDFFWTYAYAFRVSGDSRFAETAERIAHRNGLEASRDYRDVLGLLDLHAATGRGALVEDATRIARNILDHDVLDGLFVTGDAALVSDPRSIALLRLLAVLEDRLDAIVPYVGEIGRGNAGW